MKFSIVTPTRNNLDKLKRCVGSVRGQVEVEYEHIIQDAMSEDGTGDWLAMQADITGVSESDGGMYDAINRGWARSSGDILSWLNSDEQYLPGTLAMVRSVFENQPDVDFVYGNFIVVDADGRPVAARREIRLSELYISNGFLNSASCTLFFRRRLLDNGLLWLNVSYHYASDMDLILRLLKNNNKYKHIDGYLSLFAIDGTNLSCHPGMLEETESIGFSHKRSNVGMVRRFFMLGRLMERIAAGSYFPGKVEYDYVTDEQGGRVKYMSNGLSASYSTR